MRRAAERAQSKGVKHALETKLVRSGARAMRAREGASGWHGAAAEPYRHLAAIVEHSNDAIFSRTLDGTITTWNRAAARIFGFRAEEIIGRRTGVLLPRGHRDEFRRLVARIRCGEVVEHYETERLRKDGRRIHVSLTLSPIRDSACRLTGFSTIVRDITEQRRVREALTERERELLAIGERERQVLSRELHDSLGQQLSGIAYLCNVVRDRLREAGAAEAAEVARIARLLKNAIEEIRRVSRGLAPVRPEPGGLTNALSELAAHTHDVFGIICRCQCRNRVLVVDSESANHLYRIAQEAVNNAIRHGRAGRITIALSRARGRVTLWVRDNGRGIAGLSPKRKGLGLRVMKYRASLLGGTVLVRRRPSGGTEVRCVAPAAGLKAVGSPRCPRLPYE
jgi:two-component system, LuxR family, sensor kinase FixL